MDRQELYDYWAERGKARPAWVREHRDELMDHLSVDDPIPDGSLADVRDWMDRYAGTVTRQLNPENESDGETDNTPAHE